MSTSTSKGEDSTDLDGWTSLESATERAPEEREPLLELVGQDPEDYLQALANLKFQYVKGYSPITGKISLQESGGAISYWKFLNHCTTRSNCNARVKSGITVIVQQEDDRLSGNSADRIENIYPLGDAAIMVANSTEYDADSKFECDLARNILITTADGVEYCMPIAVACEPGPYGGLRLLTVEQREMAGYSPETTGTTDTGTTGEGSTESADGGGGTGGGTGGGGTGGGTGGGDTGGGGIAKSDAPVGTGGGLPKGGGYI